MQFKAHDAQKRRSERFVIKHSTMYIYEKINVVVASLMETNSAF